MYLNIVRSRNCQAKIKGKSIHINNEIYTIKQLKMMENNSINKKDSDSQETGKKSFSAPQTPTQLNHQFFNDSLSSCAIQTPSSTPQNSVANILSINQIIIITKF